MDQNQTPEKAEKGSSAGKLNAIIWTCVAILIILLLLTATLLTIMLGNFLPNETDILFLVPKEPGLGVSDHNGCWSMQNEIEVFKTEYVNEQNEIYVKSGDGTQIIAPGTTTIYKFYVQNNGNIALNYQSDIRFHFTIGGIPSNFENIPLLVRLYSDDGSYLIGTADHYEPIANAISASDAGTLGINSYDAYTLEIVWEFEGDDALDTWLGNLAGMGLSAEDKGEQPGAVFGLEISTYAEENPDPKAEGGIVLPEDEWLFEDHGGNIRWLPFIILLILIAAVGVILTVLLTKKKKSQQSQS